MLPDGLPGYWPWMVAYHQVREPLYRCIIHDLGLSPTARVLDAGSGDGFYSQLLSSLLGPRSQIVALDQNLALLKTASEPAPNVQRCLGDFERPGLAPGSFDAVWFCRGMHSAANPVALLAALVRMLRPGARLIVIENDTAHYPILPLPAEFEHRLRDARMRYERSQCDDPVAHERYKSASHLAGWLSQLGLAGLSMRTYLSEDLAPFTPEVENYWRRFLAWDANQLGPFLAPEDAARYCATFDPDSPGYLFSRPGCYCVELTTVACATRP